MALDVEGVVDGGVHLTEERWADPGDLKRCILRSRRRGRLVRILSPIVLAQALLMASGQSNFGLCRAVGAQFVRHQNVGCEALFLEQFSHEFHSRVLVASSLHQKIENLAFIVNRAPQPELPAAQSCTAISSRCHRDVGRGVSGEVLGRTSARISNTHRRTVS